VYIFASFFQYNVSSSHFCLGLLRVNQEINTICDNFYIANCDIYSFVLPLIHQINAKTMTTVAEKSTVKSAVWTIKNCSKFNPDTNLGYNILGNVSRFIFNEDSNNDFSMNDEVKKIDESASKARRYKNIFPNQVEEIAEYIMKNEALLLTVSETINNA
jgi:hypothetical protein